MSAGGRSGGAGRAGAGGSHRRHPKGRLGHPREHRAVRGADRIPAQRHADGAACEGWAFAARRIHHTGALHARRPGAGATPGRSLPAEHHTTPGQGPLSRLCAHRAKAGKDRREALHGGQGRRLRHSLRRAHPLRRGADRRPERVTERPDRAVEHRAVSPGQSPHLRRRRPTTG